MTVYVVTVDVGDSGVSWKEPDIRLVGVYGSEIRANEAAGDNGLVTPVNLNDTANPPINLG